MKNNRIAITLLGLTLLKPSGLRAAPDPCAGAPCLNGGMCSMGGGSFGCECAAGFLGPDCALIPMGDENVEVSYSGDGNARQPDRMVGQHSDETEYPDGPGLVQRGGGSWSFNNLKLNRFEVTVLKATFDNGLEQLD